MHMSGRDWDMCIYWAERQDRAPTHTTTDAHIVAAVAAVQLALAVHHAVLPLALVARSILQERGGGEAKQRRRA